MLVIARLAGALWHVHVDGTAQLDLARSFFDADAPIVAHFEAFVREAPNRVIFSEQQFFIAQRLLDRTFSHRGRFAPHDCAWWTDGGCAGCLGSDT
jgi:hypothetical protein